MKKFILLLMLIILTLSVTACQSAKDISLPDPKNIESIELEYGEQKCQVSDKNIIEEVISEIAKSAKYTNIQSINDQPTNVDNFITIKFNHSNTDESAQSIAYIYQRKGKVYIEQPYTGIWRVDDNIYARMIDMMKND